MNEAEITRYITDTFDHVVTDTDSDNRFFFYDPEGNDPQNRMFPFVTLVTNDAYDQFSNLNRPSVFRLNIGISKESYRSLFDSQTPSEEGEEAGASDREYDFTALDKVMPHPVYGRMYWVCVLNPSEETFEKVVRPLVAEAYDSAVAKHDRRIHKS